MQELWRMVVEGDRECALTPPAAAPTTRNGGRIQGAVGKNTTARHPCTSMTSPPVSKRGGEPAKRAPFELPPDTTSGAGHPSTRLLDTVSRGDESECRLRLGRHDPGAASPSFVTPFPDFHTCFSGTLARKAPFPRFLRSVGRVTRIVWAMVRMRWGGTDRPNAI